MNCCNLSQCYCYSSCCDISLCSTYNTLLKGSYLLLNYIFSINIALNRHLIFNSDLIVTRKNQADNLSISLEVLGVEDIHYCLMLYLASRGRVFTQITIGFI